MNREIKFRAFENESGRNRMFEWSEIKKEFQLWLNCNDTFVMQYTGLHDKNGKEIYEGDILKCNWLYEFDIAIEPLDGIGVVKWDNDNPCFYINLITPVKYGELDDEETTLGLCRQDIEDVATVIEIIGNLYSNPELINNNLTK